MSFVKSKPTAGARPGSLAIPPNSPPPRIAVLQYDADEMERFDVDDPRQLEAFRNSPKTTWVDVQGLGDEAVLRAIADVFGLHPLALEDAVNVPQRAKSELYQEHQVVVARAPLIGADDRLEMPQTCFVIGERYLVTFQERYFGFFDPIRERLENGNRPIRTLGPGYLACAMIAAMVDLYYPIAQDLSDELEDLEELVAEHPHPDVLARIHVVRRRLLTLRRVGRPQREALVNLLRTDSQFLPESLHVYLRDTLTQMSQIVELVDSSREWAASLVEAYLSNLSHRTNEIMKMLTLMASIFIPLTFVAGIYGMNFEYMPELHNQRGYFVVLGIMVVIAVAMVLYFRHRGWIGTPPPPEPPER